MARTKQKIFISYSRHDSDFVNRLVADLEGRDFSVWIDRSAIQGGDSWRKSIVDAISACDVFLIVISPNSVGSRNVTKEISMADERGKRLRSCGHPAHPDPRRHGVSAHRACNIWTSLPRPILPRWTGCLRRWARRRKRVGTRRRWVARRAAWDRRRSRTRRRSSRQIGVWQVQSVNMFGVVSGYGQLRLDGQRRVHGAVQHAGRPDTASGPLADGRAANCAARHVQPAGHAVSGHAVRAMLQITGVGPAGFSAVANTGDQCTFQRVAWTRQPSLTPAASHSKCTPVAVEGDTADERRAIPPFTP